MIDTSDGRFFARKVVRLFGAVEATDIDNEIRAVTELCKSGHANIVQVFEFGLLKDDSAWHFIDMELCDFTLEKYIRGADASPLLSWEQAKVQQLFHPTICHINRQILEGLIFIHGNREFHRDLSPQNSNVKAVKLN